MKHLMIACVLLTLSTPALAEAITQEKVEQHLSAFVDLYNENPFKREKIYNFVKNYTVEDGIYKNEIHVKGQEEPNIMSVNQKQLLKSINEENGETLSSSARYEIQSFEVTDSGIANVKYKFWQDATLKIVVPAESGAYGEQKMQEMVVGYKSIADCEDEFFMSGETIKSPKSNCIVEMAPELPEKN